MATLAMAMDILAKDHASPVFGKVADSAGKAGKSVEQAAAQMRKAADAEVDAASRVKVAQARLDDVRKSGKASAGQLVKAEEALADAERKQVRAQGDAVRAAESHEAALKDLRQESERTGKAGKNMGGALAGAFKLGAAGLGVGALVGGISLLNKGLDAGIELAKGSIAEARESQQVGAKTEAIIKATGGAAKVSAAQLGDLTTAISNKTGVDDEAIQSGSNLLLTFKNVRNEVGQGSDIFNRATAAAVDLSKAGFGSIDGASKTLGKALNDPLKGISALSRAGVTFTQQQKDQIATLVKSGDVLGAQKIILKEVEGQVGGVAAASTTAGEKLKTAWDNGKEAIGTALLPALDDAENGLRSKLLPFIEDKLIPALPQITDGLKTGIRLVESFGKIGAGAIEPFVKSIDGGKNATGSLVDFLETHQADITSFFVEGGHAAIGLGKALGVTASGGLKAYAALADGIGVALDFVIDKEQQIVDAGASLADALGFDKQADQLRNVSHGLDVLRANNAKSDAGAGLARSIADGIDNKLLPALGKADEGLTKVGNREIGKARQRDQAAALAQAIKNIGTDSDGSQIRLKKFSDISKLSADQQAGLRKRIKDASVGLRDQLKAAQDAGDGQKKLTKTWETGKDRLYDEFRQMGLSKEAARKLAAQYAGVQPKVQTKITQPGMGGAIGDTKRLRSAIANIDGRKVKITYSSNAEQFAKAYKLGLTLNNGEHDGSTARGGIAGGMAYGGILPGFTPVAQGDDLAIPLAGGGVQGMRRGEGVYVSEAMRDPYERARLFAVNKAALRGESLAQFREPGLAEGGITRTVTTSVNTGGLGLPDFGRLTTGIARTLGDKLGEAIGRKLDKARDAAGGPIGGAGYARALQFAQAQVGKPYVFGAAGPGGYDCSGFMAAIQNVIEGKSPYHRRYSTPAFHGDHAQGFTRGKKSPFMVGVNPSPGRSGHMAGTLNGKNVESAGGVGVRVGSSARGYNASMFSWRGGLAEGGLVGDLPWDIVDQRGQRYNPRLSHAVHSLGVFDQGGVARGTGWMPKATIRPERVLSPKTTIDFERLVGVLERTGGRAAGRSGPMVHVEHMHQGVDLEAGMQRAAFLERQGSFD